MAMIFDPDVMKVKLCQKCRGTGRMDGVMASGVPECPHCGGSGRVVVKKALEETPMSAFLIGDQDGERIRKDIDG